MDNTILLDLEDINLRLEQIISVANVCSVAFENDHSDIPSDDAGNTLRCIGTDLYAIMTDIKALIAEHRDKRERPDFENGEINLNAMYRFIDLYRGEALKYITAAELKPLGDDAFKGNIYKAITDAFSYGFGIGQTGDHYEPAASPSDNI